jgi:hypothetical protein
VPPSAGAKTPGHSSSRSELLHFPLSSWLPSCTQGEKARYLWRSQLEPSHQTDCRLKSVERKQGFMFLLARHLFLQGLNCSHCRQNETARLKCFIHGLDRTGRSFNSPRIPIALNGSAGAQISVSEALS